MKSEISRAREAGFALSAAKAYHDGMAARDRYGYDLKCDRCGSEGRIECSEDDYPFMRSPDFRVDSLTGPFTVAKLGETSVMTDVVCNSCREKVW